MQPRQLVRCFRNEAGHGSWLRKAADARVGGVNRELRRDQNRIHARSRDLGRHLLSVANVTLKRGSVAVEEQHHDAGPTRIETLGYVQQNPAVVIGAAPAVVREWCGVEFNQFGQWFLDRQTLRSDLLRIRSILKPILIKRRTSLSYEGEPLA
ncbi:MAG TPA: hypothetical protein VIH63_03450 [Xanthobacteraceae bacterium]